MEEIVHESESKSSKQDKKQKQKRTERLSEISQRLEQIDSNGAETKAIEILTGIGFTQQDLHRASKEFSGGWRMRIAIAKVIFCEPEILMLDEPTNHLDLPALIWLENYIAMLDITIIIVSHARDFLNAVCDEIIHF
jgi:ATP-binding cassette subfamily F protein 3